MIISHKYKFIFLHNPKAAGSSVTISLARYLGRFDVQVGVLDEAAEENIKPNFNSFLRTVHFRSFFGITFFMKFIGGMIRARSVTKEVFYGALDKTIKRSWRYKLGERPTHPRASDVRDSFVNEWQVYTKFCVVRNPWDRVVSEYFWRHRNILDQISFEQFVSDRYSIKPSTKKQLSRNPNDIYRINGELVLDKYIRFENLEEDLLHICKVLNINWDGWLPRSKGKTRKERNYRRYYTAETKELIEAFFKKDIEEFGYKF